jgi:hypothetical protein
MDGRYEGNEKAMVKRDERDARKSALQRACRVDEITVHV